ncbi:BatA domain-containing protein [Stenotrophomonas rhizophila]
MSLLYPLGLLALAAWLVPLLIHLARRHQYAPLDFAALRWLQARIRPRQKIRFDAWPLLLVRLLLLAALALLLARPVLHGGAADTHAVTVVAPGLNGAALRGQDAEGDWRWLAPGFPALADGAPAPHQPLASLLRELDQRLPAGAPLTVYVPDPMPGLDGERPRLSRAVNWRPVPLAPASARTATLPEVQIGAGIADAEQRVLAAIQRAWSNHPCRLHAPRHRPGRWPARRVACHWAVAHRLADVGATGRQCAGHARCCGGPLDARPARCRGCSGAGTTAGRQRSSAALQRSAVTDGAAGVARSRLPAPIAGGHRGTGRTYPRTCGHTVTVAWRCRTASRTA